MASLYEQMDNLLTPDSFKEGLAKSAEENKDESMSDIFSFDRIKKEVLPQFREKDEIIEKATATGTGLLTGTLGLPSDIISMASAGADLVGDYTNNPTFTVVKDLLSRAEKEAGRPTFDKWFTETTGLKSNPANTDQLIGEILSPTGAFLVPLKTLNKLFKPLKKGASEFFDNLPDGIGGAKLVEEGPNASNINKTSPIDDFNQPKIDMNTVGLKSADGQKAFKTYSQKEAEIMGIKGSNPAILGEKELIKYINLNNQDKYKLFRDTGMYRGADGKVRYKLDTRQATLQEGYLAESSMLSKTASGETIVDATKIPENATLKDLINYEDLFRQYGTKDNPLLNIKIKFLESTKENVNTAMAYLPNPNPNKPATIYISNNTGFNGNAGMTTKEFRSFLLHEIQHAVQRKEKFNVGGSAAKYLPVDHYKNVDILNSEINKELSNVVQVINTRTNKAPIEINESVLNTFSEKLARQELEAQLKTSRTIKNVYLPDIDTNFTAVESELHSLINHLPAFDTFMKKRISLYGKQAINAKIEKEASRKYMELPGEVEAFWIQDADAFALKTNSNPTQADISTQVLKNRPLRTENKYTERNAADKIKGEQ